MVSGAKDKGRALLEAEIDSRIFKYYLIFALLIPVGGWVILLGAFTLFLPLSLTYKRRYFDYHSLTLYADRIEFRSGVFNRRETDVPLERITDVAVVQGPLSRRFGFAGITVETAGQTRMQGTVKLDALVNANEFREAVLKQRGLVSGKVPAAASAAPVSSASSPGGDVFQEMRDLLRKIEKNTSK